MDKFPPLPPPDRTMWQYGKQIDHYTADQMQAYARSANMIAKTGAQRVKEAEARKRAAGLVRVCVWLHPDDAAALREHAAKLARKREKQ